MKRKCWLWLMVALLLVGCTRVPMGGPTKTPDPEQPAVYESYWAYRCLTAEQQQNYAAVYAAVENGFAEDTLVTITSKDTTSSVQGLSVTLPVPLSSEEEVRYLYDAFMQDNPAFFHIGNVYGYDGRQYGDERRITALKLTYTMSAAERAAAQTAVGQVKDAALASLRAGMTDFEKELALHDALVGRCEYDTLAAESDDPLTNYTASFTVYGALVKGKAVCEGYARAMQYLLNEAGIEATVVTGYDSEGQPHLWNAVKPEGMLYYLDATWNDTDTLGTYTYFNLNTEELLRSHRFDERTVGLETATETALNYYRQTNAYLDTLRIEDLAECIAARLAEGECAHLRFTDAAFDNAHFFVKSTAWFVDTVNACRPEGAAEIEGYVYTCDKTYKTITICKKTS
ncbi:MAG: hypothetical protein IKB04_06400 [Clostridia bacterium]|nr:hypothetical protein [Clostridia bacterium]